MGIGTGTDGVITAAGVAAGLVGELPPHALEPTRQQTSSENVQNREPFMAKASWICRQRARAVIPSVEVVSPVFCDCAGDDFERDDQLRFVPHEFLQDVHDARGCSLRVLAQHTRVRARR